VKQGFLFENLHRWMWNLTNKTSRLMTNALLFTLSWIKYPKTTFSKCNIKLESTFSEINTETSYHNFLTKLQCQKMWGTVSLRHLSAAARMRKWCHHAGGPRDARRSAETSYCFKLVLTSPDELLSNYCVFYICTNFSFLPNNNNKQFLWCFYTEQFN